MTQKNIEGTLAGVASAVAALTPALPADAALLAVAQQQVTSQLSVIGQAGKFNGAQVAIAADGANFRLLIAVTPKTLVV